MFRKQVFLMLFNKNAEKIEITLILILYYSRAYNYFLLKEFLFFLIKSYRMYVRTKIIHQIIYEISKHY